MSLSIFDIFTIGIGPSSSHTVGPMKAAKIFIEEIISLNKFDEIGTIKCDFYGSLALTGKGSLISRSMMSGLWTIKTAMISYGLQGTEAHWMSTALRLPVG